MLKALLKIFKRQKTVQSKDDLVKLNSLKTKQKLLTEKLEAKKAKIKELQNTLENKTYVRREAYEFFDFLSFTNRTTKEEVTSLLGDPIFDPKIGSEDIGINYSDKLFFTFCKDSKKLQSVRIFAYIDYRLCKEYLNDFVGFYDHRVDFIGKSKKEILTLFGTPYTDDSYTFKYRYHNMYVTFGFEEEESEEKCVEIFVRYPLKSDNSIPYKEARTIAENQNLKNSKRYYTKEITKLNTENHQLTQELKECENQIKELVNTLQINSNKYPRREAYEFFNLLGFTDETTKDNIINCLGEPSSWACTEEDMYFTMMIYSDGLSFMYYKNNNFLMATEISCQINDDAPKRYLKNLGIDDSRINEFLGKSKPEILKAFGTPTYSNSYITYVYDDFEIGFWFGGDDKNKMSIRIEYFSKYES